MALAEAHPNLYHLVFDVPIPWFAASPESPEEERQTYDATVQDVAELIEADVIRPHLPSDQATDLLITMRLGIVAVHIGKNRHLPAGVRVP